VRVAYPIPKFSNLRAVEAALNIVQKFWNKSREPSIDPSVFSAPLRFRSTTFDFFDPPYCTVVSRSNEPKKISCFYSDLCWQQRWGWLGEGSEEEGGWGLLLPPQSLPSHHPPYARLRTQINEQKESLDLVWLHFWTSLHLKRMSILQIENKPIGNAVLNNRSAESVSFNKRLFAIVNSGGLKHTLSLGWLFNQSIYLVDVFLGEIDTFLLVFTYHSAIRFIGMPPHRLDMFTLGKVNRVYVRSSSLYPLNRHSYPAGPTSRKKRKLADHTWQLGTVPTNINRPVREDAFVTIQFKNTIP